MNELKDKIKGAMFGLAIGDAVGGTTEFMRPQAIKARYGVVKDMLGGGAHNLRIGEVTDDTAMTIAVARGILKNPNDPYEDIGNEFIRWANTMPKDIGITCSAVITNVRKTRDWFKSSKSVHEAMYGKSAGNGSLMRTLPVALGYKDMETMEEVTALQSKMTHFDNLASEACLIYNRAVARILEGEDMKEALTAEVKGTRYEPFLTKRPRNEQSGFVVDTMNWVVYIVMNAKSYKNAILRATNNGYDSDTVAAIVGGIYGASVGYEGLPKSWREKILVKKTLDKLSSELYNLRSLQEIVEEA